MLRDHFSGDVSALASYLIDDHCGWSYLGGDCSQPAGYVSASTFGMTGEDAEARLRKNCCYCHGDRSETLDMIVSGDSNAQHEDQWLYVMTRRHLRVSASRGGRWVTAARLPWADVTDPEFDWATVECGDDFQVCTCSAGAHVRDLPREAAQLTMRQWLGRDPLTAGDAIGYHLADGTRVSVVGRPVSRLCADGRFEVKARVRFPDGREQEIAVWRAGRPVRGITPILPFDGDVLRWRQRHQQAVRARTHRLMRAVSASRAVSQIA
jgi:hypothetical protein